MFHEFFYLYISNLSNYFQVKIFPCLMLIILLVQTEGEFLCKITDRVPFSVARKIIKIGFYAKKMTESRDLIFPHKRTKVKRISSYILRRATKFEKKISHFSLTLLCNTKRWPSQDMWIVNCSKLFWRLRDLNINKFLIAKIFSPYQCFNDLDTIFNMIWNKYRSLAIVWRYVHKNKIKAMFNDQHYTIYKSSNSTFKGSDE